MSVVNTMHSKRVTDEVRHAHADTEYFYLEAKRNKKIATWAAKKLDVDKKEYFMELIGEDISKAGPKPVVDRIKKDFKNAKVKISEEKIWEKIRKFEKDVLQSMLEDHAKRAQDEMKETEKKDKKKKKKKK